MSSSDMYSDGGSPRFPLHECFDNWRERADRAPEAEEQPNESIEVRIHLNQIIVPPGLIIQLLEENNMELIQPDPSADLIIVSGIPPANGFGEQQVLEIVVRHAPDAVVA